MATYCSNPSASSSAVTIPTPGKSILKRPPSSQPSLFSRLSKFLPTNVNSISGGPNSQATQDENRPLKRAHFILPEISITYPISSINPPSMPSLKDEKRAIEDKEYERRRRVVRGPPKSPGEEAEDWWDMNKVESFYRDCCVGCDEVPDPSISAAFKKAAITNPRAVDLSGVQLTLSSASILSDVFTIEWGLHKLVFRECDLDEHTLKPILHSLLIPGTLSFLSVASNRRLKTPAFRLIGAYIKKAKRLRFLDLSQNGIDKNAMEYIVAALETSDQGLESLRLDDCNLRSAALEVLCRTIRTSSLQHISLRHNYISSAGGVALALMIRDYPDTVPITISISPTPSHSGTPESSTASSPTVSASSLPSANLPPSTPTASSTSHLQVPSSALAVPSGKSGPILPPPRHPSQNPTQTNYPPYVSRNKRRGGASPAVPSFSSSAGEQVHMITSSSQGGVTTRHLSTASGHRHDVSSHASPVNHSLSSMTRAKYDTGPSPALLDRVRAIGALPRFGALRTLDLKGNDLRNGITYLAQVLKRNRTLKLLNLSENKLDVGCLVAIAEALKYNSCLETLDMSKNPCSGPNLDGIQSLRTAFTLNSSLKRLFLSSTHLTSTGAIALAEFLPESMSLLHLDLTNNQLDLACVRALNKGLKSNHAMRCLDLSIPPGDEAFAKMCREILDTCVRNTEEAERNSKASSVVPVPSSTTSENPSADINAPASSNVPAAMTVSHIVGGKKRGVWGLIEESELAKSIQKDEAKKMENDILTRARTMVSRLSQHHLQSPSRTLKVKNQQQCPEALMTASAAIVVELRSAIQETVVSEDSERMARLLNVNDELLELMRCIPSLSSDAASGTDGAGDSERQRLVLQGLGLSFAGHTTMPDSEVEKHEQNIGVSPEPDTVVATDSPDLVTHHHHHHLASNHVEGHDQGGLGPTPPRMDKGKRRAEPAEEKHEIMTRPLYTIHSDSDEDDERRMAISEMSSFSPTERSRSWVEEEGEVFRKGTFLLKPEELEGEYDSEELRKELLEAMVERPPPRSINEVEMDGPLSPDPDVASISAPLSPSVGSPSPTSRTTGFLGVDGLNSPLEQATKRPPRPYLSRRSLTTAATSSVVSPFGSANAATDPGSPPALRERENSENESAKIASHT